MLVGIFHETNVAPRRCVSKLRSFVSDVTNFFAESNNSFLILQEYFLDSFVLVTMEVLYTTN